MIRIIVHRLLWAVPLLVAVSLFTFVLVAIAGDPVYTILGSAATESSVAALREQLGLNDPLWERYVAWATGVVQGDFGTSLVQPRSVTDLIASRFPVTLSLALLGTALSAIVGIWFGVVGAQRPGPASRALDAVAMIGFAAPPFVIGILLVTVFALQIPIFPATGYVAFSESPSEWLASLALPVLTLTIGGVAAIAKLTRDAMRDVLASDFVDVLRADGCPERRIVWRYALRNASIPVLTSVGLVFVTMLGGAVIVENVFALPGLGQLTVTSAAANDIPVIQATTLYFCIVVVAVNLVVDLLYGFLNPKARTA